MSGFVTIVVGFILAVGGFFAGVPSGAREGFSIPATICCVGGLVIMAIGRAISILGDIHEAIKPAGAKKKLDL